MQGNEPYCYRCRQIYGCICDPAKYPQYTEASVIIRELESSLDSALELARMVSETYGSFEKWRPSVMKVTADAILASAVETPSPKERTDFQKFVDDEMPGLVAEFQKRQSE